MKILNRIYDVNLSRKKSRKILIQILKIPSVTELNRQENCSNLRISVVIYRPKLFGKVFLQ